MSNINLSLTNPKIKSFFDKESDLAPVGEFLFVHTHFVESNFVSQIEVMINEATIKLSSSKKTGVTLRLKEEAEKLAILINDVNEQSANKILLVLREIYQLCKIILA